MVGVYLIRCLVNDRVYAGSSRDVDRRLREHLRKLRRGKHENRHLHAAWNKHGALCFASEVIATPSPEKLLWAEQLFIDAVFKLGVAFNGNRYAHSRAP